MKLTNCFLLTFSLMAVGNLAAQTVIGSSPVDVSAINIGVDSKTVKSETSDLTVKKFSSSQGDISFSFDKSARPSEVKIGKSKARIVYDSTHAEKAIGYEDEQRVFHKFTEMEFVDPAKRVKALMAIRNFKRNNLQMNRGALLGGTKGNITPLDTGGEFPEDFSMYLDTGYWGDLFQESTYQEMSYWYNDYATRPPICRIERTSCRDRCNDIKDRDLSYCAASGIAFGIIATPITGAAVGAACAAGVNYVNYDCKYECETNVVCN
jgi:hypothetical protein